METRIREQVKSYINKMKQDILECTETSVEKGAADVSVFVRDYPVLELTKDDFTRRKRVKKPLDDSERCEANCVSGVRCSRRRKEGARHCVCHVCVSECELCEREGVLMYVSGERVYSAESVLCE